MWAAILNKNTASFSMCKLSKLSAPEPTLEARVPPEGPLDSVAHSSFQELLAKNRDFTNNPVAGVIARFRQKPSSSSDSVAQ
jgi:hypothetical protein